MLIRVPVFKGLLVFYGIPVSGIKKYLDIDTGANKNLHINLIPVYRPAI